MTDGEISWQKYPATAAIPYFFLLGFRFVFLVVLTFLQRHCLPPHSLVHEPTRRCADIRNVHSTYSPSPVVDLKTKIKCTVWAATFIYLFKSYAALALFTYGGICAIINRSILRRKTTHNLTRHRVTD